MSPQTTLTVLKLASAIVIGFGLVIALAALPAAAGPMRVLLDLVFWPVDGGQSLAAPETRFLAAICGGVLVGWGVMLWLVATRVYPRDPVQNRSLILVSIGAWFIVDSLGSIASGAPLNAFFNIGFVLIFALPLLRSVPKVRA